MTYPQPFIAWVEQRTGLLIGWQSEASLEFLYAVWLAEKKRKRK